MDKDTEKVLDTATATHTCKLIENYMAKREEMMNFMHIAAGENLLSSMKLYVEKYKKESGCKFS